MTHHTAYSLTILAALFVAILSLCHLRLDMAATSILIALLAGYGMAMEEEDAIRRGDHPPDETDGL